MKILFITLIFISLSCYNPDKNDYEPDPPPVNYSDEEKISELEKDVDELMTENQELEDKVKSLEQQIRDLEFEIEELSADNNDLINEINYLNGN